MKNYLGPIVVAICLSFYFWGKPDLFLEKKQSEAELKNFSMPFSLKNRTKEVGIKHIHETSPLHKTFSNVSPWLRSIGSSAAVVDLDGSGWYDIYLTTQKIGGKNHYYKNNRNGTFTEIAEQLKIADVNNPYPSWRSIFIDYDNDGKKDLLLLSYCPRLFHNEGKNGFIEKKKDTGFSCGTSVGGANAVELNHSGFLDIIIAPYLAEDLYYNPKSTIVMPDNFFQATTGVPVQFFKNNGNGNFVRIPEGYGLGQVGWGHTLGVFDVRNTGKKDIWFPKDYGTEKIYYENSRNQFENIKPALIEGTYNFGRNGMSIDMADVDNDGHPLIFVSHIFSPSQKLSGNNLWKWMGENNYKQEAHLRGVMNCGWAWGSKFIDFDNNGFLDLVVVNGFLAANPKKSYWYTMSVLEASGAHVQEDIKNWPAIKDSSLDGYQKSCLYYNNKKGEFLDVSSKTDLDLDLLEGRAVAAIDYLNNGSPSLVISNQNGEARFYANEQKNKNKWIGFKFLGTKSNRDGWGVKVKVVLNDKTLTRELEPLNGYAVQNEDRMLIGLGENPQIKYIEVEWPSQIKQRLSALDLNHYHLISEPR